MMPKQTPSTQTAKKPGMPPKKVHTREFKLETLRLLRSSDNTKADLARELGLYPGHKCSGSAAVGEGIQQRGR
jgi:transposase-like protein